MPSENRVKELIDIERLPKHVAVIMDGNGRWAKQHGMQRVFGHKHGVQSVRDVTEAAAELGIEYLTLYAFSTENWNRPKNEVDALMGLLVDTIEKETPTLLKNNVRLLQIGDMSHLPSVTRERFEKCIADTAGNTGLKLVLALSYSSREEIVAGIRGIAEDVCKGKLSINDIDAQLFNNYLMTAGMAEPDLLIRTSGELRISNFLLWQLAYTELYFTDVLWPDFNKEEFYKAIIDYQGRERRFGKTSEQLK